MGQPEFPVGGRIFATLASADKGYGNRMLTAEQQAAFVEEMPDAFLLIKGGWGRMGMTHIRVDVSARGRLGRRPAHSLEATQNRARRSPLRKAHWRNETPRQETLRTAINPFENS
jgi:hypothetical protein